MLSPDVVMLRQRGSLVVGWLGIVVVGLLLVALLVSGSLLSSLGLTAVLLLVLGLTWVLLLRPAVALQPDGVVLHNPFRDTFLPWSAIESTRTRWMLEVHTARGDHASWAIGSSQTRPSQFVLDSYRRGGGPRAPRVTATSASQLIDERRAAYVAAAHPPPSGTGIDTRWDGLELLAVGLPAVLLGLSLVL